MRVACHLTIVIGCLFAGSPVIADAPSVSYIFPAGGQRGTTVKFHVGGHFLHGEAPFRMEGAGVKATGKVREVATKWFEGPVIPQPASQRKEDYPKDHLGEVTISPDAPLGERFWRVWTSQGVTPGMKFVVGDLPEVTEEEVDGKPIPVEVKLPVTINGRIFPREDVDIWSFRAKQGQTVWCEVNAARIGSALDSRLEIRDARGRRLAENTDYFAADSFVRFTAPSDGMYRLHIHDINFGGLQHYVYRLTVSDGPHVEMTYPAGGRRGSRVPVQLIGTNVSKEAVEVALPNESSALRVSQRAMSRGQWTNPFLMEVGDVAEVLETEPNDDAANAAPVDLPGVANGRIGRPGDVDHWSFSASKGQTLRLDLRAARLGSPLDSVLVVSDGKGKELARSDDMSSGQTDSQVSFRAPADGTYTARVEERFPTRGGPRFVYRLEMNPATAEPDFQLTMPTDAISVMREGQTRLKVDVRRLAAFKGEIELKLEGAPKGVAFSPTKIPAKKNNVQLTFKADQSAPIGVTPIKLVGTAAGAESKPSFSRTASLPADYGSPKRDRLFLGVGMPAPFKFTAAYRISYAGQGTTHRKRYTIERNGYDGPLTVMLADRQIRHLQGVVGPKITVPAGANEFEYAVQLPPWLAVGRTSRTVLMALGEVVDTDGTRHRVSYSSGAQNDQIIVLADPCPLSVVAMRSSIPARPGQSVDVPVRVERSREVNLPVKLALAPAKHLHGVTADPVTVAADDNTATLRIRFANDCGPFNMPITIRGIARRGDDRFVAEGKIVVVQRD